jgi:magnesium-transporting ATPase (P-type)
MLDAIAIGRSIYINSKKAIKYFDSHSYYFNRIYPLGFGLEVIGYFDVRTHYFLGINYGSNMFYPFKNEHMEQHTMTNNPRPFVAPFFNWSELTNNILQALVITAGTLCR